MDISGTWTGEYAFDEIPEAKAVAGHVVTFSVTLKQGWLGFITGTIQDDARTGFPEPGVIKGRIKKDSFGFRKIMPKFRMIHESNRITLEQWSDRHKLVINTSQPHPPILHMGKISADGNSIEGRWRIPAITIDVPGSYQAVAVPVLTGTWKISRKN